MKINVGCGDKKLKGYVNVDLYGEPDVRCDLSTFPWPFADNSIEEVVAEHFLEHVNDYERTVIELNRILVPGGTFHFRVPHFRSSYYPWHLHKYAFSTMTCRLLCYKLPYLFGGRQLFEFDRLRINFLYMPRIVCWVLGVIANIWAWGWDYFGLPIAEIECWVHKPR